jgi:hypothetical protein
VVHNLLKKTFGSTQNLENKGSEIFLPARSMVPKVVTGKILETLELAWFLGIGAPVPVLRLELGHHAKALFFQCFAGWPLLGTTLSICACWSNKKSVDTAQNIENKRPEIFLPRRSMVLKVVRGKILEKLELASFRAARGSVLAPRAGVR